MRLQEVDLIGDFYSDSTRPWSQQDTVNWIPVLAERSGTRTPKKLRSAPGLRPFAVVGAGPIRGMRNVEGRLFVVSGGELYQVLTDGSAILRGTIPGVGLVSLSHNQITGGNEVLIVNGTSGYVWNTVTETLVQVTDDGYPGAFVVDYVDQFLVQVEPFRRFWFHSQLADALDYNTLDRYESEASPDLIRTLVVYQRQVFVFNERTIEPFVNVGTATGTFQRASGVVIEKGCKARYSATRVGNTVCWLGDDDVIYALNGYNPQPISTKPIADHIRRLTETQKEGAFAFAYEDAGHEIYYLTFPNDLTWGYDLTTGLWHRRESFELTRWRLNALEKFNGFWLGGDFQNGTLYTVDWDWMQEGQDPLVSSRTAGVLHAGQNKLIINAVEILIDTQGQLSKIFDPPNVEFRITGDVPDGAVGVEMIPYQYETQGGVPPYGDYELDSGAFPPGWGMSATGLVTGTPTVDGIYTWRIRRQDAEGNIAFLDDTANIGQLWTAGALCLPANQGFWLKADAATNSLVVGSAGRFYRWIDSCNSSDFRTVENNGSGLTIDGALVGEINGIRAAHFSSSDPDCRGIEQNNQSPHQNNIKNIVSGRQANFIIAIWRNASQGSTPAERRVVYWSLESPANGNSIRVALRASAAAQLNGVAGVVRQDAGTGEAVLEDTTDHSQAIVIGAWVIDWLNGEAFLYVNGVLAGSVAIPGFVGVSDPDRPLKFFIGSQDQGSSVADIHLGELIAQGTTAEISEGDRQLYEGALAWFWRGDQTDGDPVGLLPAGHPYKLRPPTIPFAP